MLSPIFELYLQQCKKDVWNFNKEGNFRTVVYFSLINLKNACNMSESKVWHKLSHFTDQCPEIVNKVQRVRIFLHKKYS
jgi:hypothetical protein